MANTTAFGDTGEGFETGGEHNRFWRYWRKRLWQLANTGKNAQKLAK